MPRVELNYFQKNSSKEIYDLVCQVKKYPEFIEWIEDITVMDYSIDSGGVEIFKAKVNVLYKGISKNFSTNVQCNPTTKTVSTNLVHGPFKTLKNEWRITNASNGCRVQFEAEFELNNKLLGMLVQSGMRPFSQKILKEFKHEAKRRYTLKNQSCAIRQPILK